MLKGGFLGLLGSTIILRTIEEVEAETRWPALPVVVEPAAKSEAPETGVAGEAGEPCEPGLPGEAVETDALLLDFARGRGLPLISEDRKLLFAAGEAGLDYYNSLMMLAFLRYRGRIDRGWFGEARAHLLTVARYSQGVLDRFEEICALLDLD